MAILLIKVCNWEIPTLHITQKNVLNFCGITQDGFLQIRSQFYNTPNISMEQKKQ